MSTFAERFDKVVDALGAATHPLAWALHVVECVLTAALALAGVAVAARWTPWGWTLAALAATWLVGLVRLWWRPVLHLLVFGWLL